MKKKIWIFVLAAVLLAVVLFTPIPKSALRDGGTREYTALTYKIVQWKRLSADGTHEATRVYWFPDNLKSIDQLWKQEEKRVVHQFTATVLELNSELALVQPVAGEEESIICDKIAVGIESLGDIGATVGSEVVIYYDGGIMETYPAQVRAVKWEMAKDLRHKAYDGSWLDKEKAEEYQHSLFEHLKIMEIYADCFFAVPAIPVPYTIKVNGQLSEDWCVGDQVVCTYENLYCDEEQQRFEADMLTIAVSDWEPDPMVAYKPVIYLYPEEETEITVLLTLNGKLTCTYPAYDGGWKVTAAPDGTLTDAKGQTYNYLYWEGETEALWDMTEGFCVKGADTAAFLEAALAKLGLSRREANEFIVYWLPLMEQNPYNIISFQTEVYTDAAKLQITPAPDTLIRVFMAWKAADNYVELPVQVLTAPERTGFTVVEWGGTELS